MKKYTLILLTLLICESLVYSQILREPELSNEPLHQKRNLPLDIKRKASSSSFIESFESTSFPPSGWNKATLDGGDGWTRQTVGSQLPGFSSGTITTPTGGGNAVAYCRYSNVSDYNNQSLFTPTIENIQSSDTLFFWTRNQLGIADSIFIYFSNDSIDIFLGGVYYPITGANTNWQKWYIPLGERVPVGSSGYIEFWEYIDDNLNYGGAICLDLVQLNSTTTESPPTTTTGNATSITTTTAVLNGTVNPNGLPTGYFFAYGTSTNYDSFEIGAVELTGSNSQPVSATISGLTPNTEYHFELSAANDAGDSFGGDVTFLTSSTSSGVNLSPISLTLSTFNWQVGNSINADIVIKNFGTSTASAFQAQIYLSDDPSFEQTDITIGNTISFTPITSGNSQTQSTSFSVPSVPIGVYYLFVGADVNGVVDESDESDNYIFSSKSIIVGYPSTIQLTTSYSFTDPQQTSSYRMIGIPGNVNLPISQTLTGSQGEDWVVYSDNGSSSNYLVPYDGSNNFNFTPGKGFWILSNSNFTISNTVNSVELHNEEVIIFQIGYPIPLHSGWNIITNPFEINTDWDFVQFFNSISEFIYDFNGGYSQSTILETYKGYYFYNATDLSELYIPYIPSGFIPKLSNHTNNSDNKIIFSISDGTYKIASVNIGMSEESVVGYDKNDRFIPPGDFEEKRISIYNSNLETEYKYLSKDYRNPNENHIYEIEIKYPIEESYDLIIEGIENIDPKSAYLVGPNVNFVNLKSKSSLQLISSQKINKYTLLVGSDDFIENQRNQFQPEDYNLSQNYPNPFNPKTRIIYSIPEESFVSLRVFDILGEEILTLVNEKKSAGNYEVNFNGDNLSSGIYFYTLNSGNFVETKKMVLLR